MLSSPMSRILALVLPLALSPAPAAQAPVPQGAGAAPANGQRPEAVFRANVEYVEVTVRVTTADGRFVTDLSQDDFEIREEGRPQAITGFRLVDLPTAPPPETPAAWRDAEPDVQTNAPGAEGRVYVLVLDSLHVQPERTRDVRQMARRFLERYFADGDLAAVVSTSGTAESGQDFTTSRARLISAVDRFGVTVTTLETDEPTVRDMVPGGPTTLAKDTLTSLETLAGTLGGIRGRRKAIVFFSEGPGFCGDDSSSQTSGGMQAAGGKVQDVTSRPVDEPASRSRAVLTNAIQRLVSAANRNNVAIYSIDPKTLMASPATPASSGRACDIEAGVQSLRDISEQTGGFATVNTNNVDAGLGRLRQESSRYYVLGYYPSERAPEGTFRRIDVRTRRSGLKVDARQGYRVPPRPPAPARAGETSLELREAMNSVIPVAGVRLTANSVPFRSDGPDAMVLISLQIDGRDITFSQTEGRIAGNLELALATLNSRGEKGPALAEAVRLPLDETTRASVVSSGIRLVRSITLPAGRYQLRVGVTDRPTGRAGVVHLDLVVPDYRKAAFDVGGLLLSSSLAGKVPTARGGPLVQLQQQLPGPPTLVREFRAGEELAIYTELYGARATAAAIVTVSILGEEGREALKREEPAGPSPSADAAATTLDRIEVRRRVPLKGLAPGRYLLRVEARPAAGEGPVVRREVPFTIVP